jgi:hypothetical protein
MGSLISLIGYLQISIREFMIKTSLLLTFANNDITRQSVSITKRMGQRIADDGRAVTKEKVQRNDVRNDVSVMDYIDTNCPKSKRSKYFKISEYA